MMQRKKRRVKKKKGKVVLVIGVMSICIIIFSRMIIEGKQSKSTDTAVIYEEENEATSNINGIEENNNISKNTNDWNLTLVNINNALKDDFKVELEKIDEHRQFDKRAIGYLMQMINDMKKAGNNSVWVQSAYRSIETQKRLFNNKVKEYVNKGKSQKEAEELTLKTINKPGTSEHNLGLAVDFNYVNEGFDKTKEYKWLKENAENYGFILRYSKEKVSITKVSYEPWHWRYVGKEHAREINRLNMCLEEYIEYLKGDKK